MSKPKRLTTDIEQAGDDWYVTVKLDEYPIFEECYFGELEAREHAEQFGLELLAYFTVAERDWCASVCDDVAGSASRTPVEKAVARVLAERIRSGRL